MNKKKLMLFGVLSLFAVSLVVATGYVVSTLNLNVGVEEPFIVEYAMLGDAGDYDVGDDGTCAENTEWFSAGDTSGVPIDNMYPGESRKLCVKIDNAGESPIDYTVTSKIQTGFGNYADCAIAFPEDPLTGTANNGETITGEEFTVPGNAPAVDNCLIDITVARG